MEGDLDETIRAVTYFLYDDTRFVDGNGSSGYTPDAVSFYDWL